MLTSSRPLSWYPSPRCHLLQLSSFMHHIGNQPVNGAHLLVEDLQIILHSTVLAYSIWNIA